MNRRDMERPSDSCYPDRRPSLRLTYLRVQQPVYNHSQGASHTYSTKQHHYTNTTDCQFTTYRYVNQCVSILRIIHVDDILPMAYTIDTTYNTCQFTTSLMPINMRQYKDSLGLYVPKSYCLQYSLDHIYDHILLVQSQYYLLIKLFLCLLLCNGIPAKRPLQIHNFRSENNH